MTRLLLCTACIMCVTGCGEPLICTTEFVYGITATVTDAAGAAVDGATLTLTDGNYSETMEERPDGTYVGAGERQGTYTLVVEADGFQAATVEDIVVDANECHVIPESRTITLMPQ